ncbi:hypothetical protein ABIE67_009480 [Streptomyces sp. V4I8]|uniref:hypothetical protein n=1 Tax=Streptomyces sp. V4I8 TaxID=3156469 RepID=UPI0035178494
MTSTNTPTIKNYSCRVGDVSEPQPVRGVGGEDAPHSIVVDRRPGLGVLAATASLSKRAPPAVVPADPPGGPLGHHLARGAGLVDKEAVAELRVVAVSVEQCIGPVCLARVRRNSGVLEAATG